jgi:hypothetical protein
MSREQFRLHCVTVCRAIDELVRAIPPGMSPDEAMSEIRSVASEECVLTGLDTFTDWILGETARPR